jgi:DNA-binding MarR family transcriptional regulator
VRQYDFENSVGTWIFITAHAFGRALNEQLGSLGITHRQWEVLAWLSHFGELSQSELAERMCIEAPTLVGVLDRMERDGWIVRVPDESDRRRKLIRATERVEPAWLQMIQCGLRVRALATNGLSKDELATLRTLLDKVCENMGVDMVGGAKYSLDGDRSKTPEGEAVSA